jgi:predicted hydrocarbon binding protein
MYESVYSSSVQNIHLKLDAYIAGIIEGTLKKATNQKWQVDETKCIANGDDYCEFNCKLR